MPASGWGQGVEPIRGGGGAQAIAVGGGLKRLGGGLKRFGGGGGVGLERRVRGLQRVQTKQSQIAK